MTDCECTSLCTFWHCWDTHHALSPKHSLSSTKNGANGMCLDQRNISIALHEYLKCLHESTWSTAESAYCLKTVHWSVCSTCDEVLLHREQLIMLLPTKACVETELSIQLLETSDRWKFPFFRGCHSEFLYKFQDFVGRARHGWDQSGLWRVLKQVASCL